MALRSDSFKINPKEEKVVPEAKPKTPYEAWARINKDKPVPPEGRYAMGEDGHAFWEMPKKKVEETVDNSITFKVEKQETKLKSQLEKTVDDLKKEDKPGKKKSKEKVKK